MLLHCYKESSLNFLLTKHIPLFLSTILEIICSHLIQPWKSIDKVQQILFFVLSGVQMCPFVITSFLHFPAFKLFDQLCSSRRTTILHKIQIVTTNQRVFKDDKLFSFSDLYFSQHPHLLLSMVAEYLDLQNKKMPIGNIINFMHFFSLILVVVWSNLQSPRPCLYGFWNEQ